MVRHGDVAANCKRSTKHDPNVPSKLTVTIANTHTYSTTAEKKKTNLKHIETCAWKRTFFCPSHITFYSRVASFQPPEKGVRWWAMGRSGGGRLVVEMVDGDTTTRFDHNIFVLPLRVLAERRNWHASCDDVGARIEIGTETAFQFYTDTNTFCSKICSKNLAYFV